MITLWAKAAWMFLSSKIGVILLLCALTVALFAGVYTAGKASEKANSRQAIAKVEKKLQALKDERNQWVEYSELAAKQAQQSYDKLVEDTNYKLETIAALKNQVKVITKEVVKYVTPEDDAKCSVNTGFVRMFNYSLSPDITVPFSPSRLDGDSTSVTLSSIARVATANNAECVARGEVIDAWAVWYKGAKSAYEQAQAQSAR